MRKFIAVMLISALVLPLSGCWLAAGAAGGYIYRDQQAKENGGQP